MPGRHKLRTTQPPPQTLLEAVEVCQNGVDPPNVVGVHLVIDKGFFKSWEPGEDWRVEQVLAVIAEERVQVRLW